MNSLPIAFMNLLQRYGIDSELSEFGDEPNWQTITEVVPGVSLGEFGVPGSWPKTDDAIILFRHQSIDEPYTDDGGFQTANMTETYCLVADWSQRLIVDPVDNAVKAPGLGGHAIGWASYEIPPNLKVEPKPSKESVLYTWVTDDNFWDVARRLQLDPVELMEHNDITDPGTLQPGDVLHLPTAKPLQADQTVRYEVLPVPVQMHVSRQGGAKKWSFGNARTWADISGKGFYPEHTNLVIAAIAYVPITEKDGSHSEAAYYMDSIALGDYADTGLVRYTIGYSWADLDEGLYERPVPMPTLEPEPEPEPEVIEEPVRLEPTKYKDSFQALPEAEACTVILPEDMDYIYAHEYDSRQPDLKIPHLKEVKITGTFEFDGVVLGRLQLAEKFEQDGYYFGIPVDYLKQDADMYNTELDDPTRIAINGPHTLTERIVTDPLARLLYKKIKRKTRKNRSQK